MKSSIETFSESTERQMCIDQEQQYKCSSIYQSPGGDTINKTLLVNMGVMTNGNSEQHQFKSSPHSWEEKHSCRSIESNKDMTDKYFISVVGSSTDRSFCFVGKQTNRNILHMDSTSESSSFG
jgi:hypothetical protein